MTTFDEATKQVLEEARCELSIGPEITSDVEARTIIRKAAGAIGTNDLVRLNAEVLFNRAHEQRSVTRALDAAIARLSEKINLASASEQRVKELTEKLTEARDMICGQWCSGGDGYHSVVCDEMSELIEKNGGDPVRPLPLLKLR